jgi:hypothetical protein
MKLLNMMTVKSRASWALKTAFHGGMPDTVPTRFGKKYFLFGVASVTSSSRAARPTP